MTTRLRRNTGKSRRRKKTRNNRFIGIGNAVDAWAKATENALTTRRIGRYGAAVVGIGELLADYEKIMNDSDKTGEQLTILKKLETALPALTDSPNAEVKSAADELLDEVLQGIVDLLDTNEEKTDGQPPRLQRTQSSPDLLRRPESETVSTRQTRALAVGEANFQLLSGNIQRDVAPRVDVNALADWSRARAAYYMTDGKARPTLEEQNIANAVVWYNTMFSGNNPTGDPDQERVLKEQQEFLMRHFLAMALLGVQGGLQKTDRYAPLEQFQNKDGTQVNLASTSSGGGRVNYRSRDGAGDDLHNFLFFGNDPVDPDWKDKLPKKEKKGNELYTSPVGAYDRVSTHTESFENGEIREGSAGFTPAIGINIPIGGVGQKLKHVKGHAVTTGYQGTSSAGKNQYQTGTGLIRHNTSGDLSSTLVSFEGSAPFEDNIFGGSHGILALGCQICSSDKIRVYLNRARQTY